MGTDLLSGVLVGQCLDQNCAAKGNVYPPVGIPRPGLLDEPVMPDVIVWIRPVSILLLSVPHPPETIHGCLLTTTLPDYTRTTQKISNNSSQRNPGTGIM